MDSPDEKALYLCGGTLTSGDGMGNGLEWGNRSAYEDEHNPGYGWGCGYGYESGDGWGDGGDEQ